MQKISENKFTGNVYHFVTIPKLKYLIEHDFVFRLVETGSDEPHTNYKYYVSLTRKYNFEWTNYRITFDVEKLSRNYKLTPFHYFNYADKRDYPEDAHPDLRYPYDENGVRVDSEMWTNQYEERLLTNKKHINLKPYIIQIDLLSWDNKNVQDWDSFFNKKDIARYYTEINDLGIRCNIVDKMYPYSYQKFFKQKISNKV